MRGRVVSGRDWYFIAGAGLIVEVLIMILLGGIEKCLQRIALALDALADKARRP